MRVRRAIRTFLTSVEHLKVAVRCLPLNERARFVYRGLPISFRKNLFSVTLKGSKATVYLRSNSSDLTVFSQIFYEAEYAPLLGDAVVETILDLGANVGLSSVWFLTHFPQAKLIAVEPDVENFAVLQKNLEPFGNRATAVRAAVWSSETSLKMSDSPYRDGRHWARQVIECSVEDPDAFIAVSVPGLMTQMQSSRISILKVDIEGAEAKVFEAASVKWLDRIDTIAIELHEDTIFGPCSSIFNAAISDQKFMVSTSGELTICKRF